MKAPISRVNAQGQFEWCQASGRAFGRATEDAKGQLMALWCMVEPSNGGI
jgi:hypothetical protein